MKAFAAEIAAVLCVLAAACAARAGIVSPRGGGPYPEHYRELKAKSKDAFTMRRAWIGRLERQRAGDTRYRLLIPAGETPLAEPQRALGGRIAIPVVLGTYSNITIPPVTNVAIDRELFTGPWTPGTMKQYWSEVSFGLLEVTGTVYDWVALAQNEAYYTGGIYQGLDTLYSRTGEMIKEILDARDAAVDFGAYDNDGPDGIPNSGDDDGFVDVLLVVHPTYGAECDYTAHMWSHSWNYSSWPVSRGAPYATNDPAAGGGVIRIDDYIIVPALSCETGMIEIGVICHEVGHALGLPDLYDFNGGGSGIGYWGLMGAGNWNTPASPAHPEVWSREQLGWLNPVAIDWRPQSLTLRAVETTGDAVKIALPTRRFRRATRTPGNGALICGYNDAEAAARQWPAGAGYGNGWNESMFREFSIDGSRPVALQYDVSFDLERDYDFGMLLLELGGSADTLALYTGQGAKREVLDLDARLPSGPCSFVLRFEFLSDISVSDEDNWYDSRAGYAFSIDNVRLTGGGLDYAADFEMDSGSWRQDSAPAEYFIVENRRRIGFDVNLPGQGLLIWHAENSIAYTLLGNSGGVRNTQCRGLVLEEGDGGYHLLLPSHQGGNYGDAGDPYPGAAGNRSFGPTTVPRSHSNGGAATPVVIGGVSSGSGSSSAQFVGGMPAPSIASAVPDTIDKLHDSEAVLDVRGSWMLYGAGCALARGPDTVRARSVEWLGEERIVATFGLEGLYAGDWNVVVRSGDGQAGSLEGGVSVLSVYRDASVTEGSDHLLAAWTLEQIPGIRGCLLFRSDDGGPFVRVTSDTLRGTGGAYSHRDGDVSFGVEYAYRIVTYLAGGIEEPYVLRGPFIVGRSPFVTNHPNPFNARTTVSFFVPEARRVEIDVYDVSGRRVDRLAAREYGRGMHAVSWNPSESGAAAGVYFCVYRWGGATRVAKMVYLP